MNIKLLIVLIKREIIFIFFNLSDINHSKYTIILTYKLNIFKMNFFWLQILLISPKLGELLGNKNGINLTGLRKMYVAKKQIRIVYEIVENIIVVKVLAIGKRKDMEVYNKLS